MLKIHTLPPTGGDTLWASGYEVYDRLSPAMATFLEGLTATHDASFFHDEARRLGNPLRKGVRGSPLNVGEELKAVHPVIRTNRMFSFGCVGDGGADSHSCDRVEIGVCQQGVHQEDQRGDQGRVGRAAAVFVQCMSSSTRSSCGIKALTLKNSWSRKTTTLRCGSNGARMTWLSGITGRPGTVPPTTMPRRAREIECVVWGKRRIWICSPSRERRL
jgi:hypothetical protein